MTLCVRDAFLAIASVSECVNNITHIPCVILHMLEEFYPFIGNCHGEAVVKTDAPDVCRDTKKGHPRYIFSNGDDIGVERMQGIVRL